jgi:hypothetical protein
MMGSFMQWAAIIVEFVGLLLIAIKLYFPKSSERLKVLFEESRPRFMNRPMMWIGLYILIWIVAAAVLSIWDPSKNIIVNMTFTVFTVFVLMLFGISRISVRLGVVLGRGNSVAGVGLVLALIGFSLEVSQMALGS